MEELRKRSKESTAKPSLGGFPPGWWAEGSTTGS